MKVGSYVICIDDSNFDDYAFECFSALPQKQQIYQVRKIYRKKDYNLPNNGIALAGIEGELCFFELKDGLSILMEYHFSSKRFVELVPIKSTKLPYLIQDNYPTLPSLLN